MGTASNGGINLFSPAYLFAGDLFMEKNKKDYLLKTLGMQFLICLLLFAVLFGLKESNNDLFDEVKKMFSEQLEEQIDKDDLIEAFNSVNSGKMSDNTDNKAVITPESDEEAYVPFEEPSLSAEIIAEGGVDISIASKDEIPDNVSVSSYILNKNMVAPLSGEITSKFGVRTHPISNELSFHSGIDIAADEGKPIYSAFDGTVITADYDQWNGNYLKIKHENEILTVYCHCKKLNVEEGQNIRAGEIIAFVGSTGNSTGPHLHFELRINDISYDPEIALDGAKNAI